MTDGAAAGTLYLDAGDGYGYQQGEYHLRQYSLSAGTIRSVGLHSSTAFVPTNWLERVELLGVAAPSTVRLTAGGEQREIDFSWSETSKRLVLRKPAVSMVADWSIELLP